MNVWKERGKKTSAFHHLSISWGELQAGSEGEKKKEDRATEEERERMRGVKVSATKLEMFSKSLRSQTCSENMAWGSCQRIHVSLDLKQRLQSLGTQYAGRGIWHKTHPAYFCSIIQAVAKLLKSQRTNTFYFSWLYTVYYPNISVALYKPLLYFSKNNCQLCD